MKRTLILVALLAATPLFGQQVAAPSADDAIVAKINDDTLTRAKLDRLWNRLGERARKQYEKSGGGKAGFLENYVRKHLLVQKALASGFDKRPEVQAELEAARESALFDLYVRDVVSSQIVTEAAMRKFYDENQAQFHYGDRRYVRYLLISTKGRTPEEARAILSPIMVELYSALSQTRASGAPIEQFGKKFSEYARKHSEDPTAAMGGDLGWLESDQLDAQVSEAVFQIPVGSMSGMVQTDKGVQLFFIEKARPAEMESYEKARPAIREFLLGQNMNKIMDAVNQATTSMKSTGKVQLFPENIE